MIANTPLLKKTLSQSNIFYSGITDSKRPNVLKTLDMKWKNSRTATNSFIRQYTDNPISNYLKEQQIILNGEYGEIFLTNRFGALVASTAKLSTFAHGHKYWWQGAYNNGTGKIFFDDRGYDDSVDGYVLGVVVPIRDAQGIAGILKCNVNIQGAIDKLLSHPQNDASRKVKLVRSGGLIVFEEGSMPLSTRVGNAVLEKLNTKHKGSSIVTLAGKKCMIGFSEIKLTASKKGYDFGGSVQSIDHKQGNTGESWYVLEFHDIDNLLLPAFASIKKVAAIIIFMIFILAIIALVLGRQFAKPVTALSQKFGKVAKGDFKAKLRLNKKDEFGILAQNFNDMTEELGHTTTTIAVLEKEIASRKKIETENMHLIKELQETIQHVTRLRGMLPICAHCKKIRDDQGYWNQIESYIADHSEAEFSHGICPECMKTYYPDIQQRIKNRK